MHIGPNWPLHCDHDGANSVIVSEVKKQQGRVINSPKEVGGYPKLARAAAPVDTDRDGMPDAWEKAKGLNPRNASDGNKDRNGDGYTNVEEYLHSLLK